MPKFEDIFSVLKSDRKLTKEELIRAIRFSIAAEYEAIQLYNQLAESIDDPLAIKVLNDVANEEKEHVGEFWKVLTTLDPKEIEFYKEGEKEVEELKFASENKALQYLSDFTGKKIKIAGNRKVLNGSTFMEPQITEKQDWLELDTMKQGTVYIPIEYAEIDTSWISKNKIMDIDDLSTEQQEELRTAYPDNLYDIATVQIINGHGARMSASGYMDATEWAVFDTEDEAMDFLENMYEDPDSEETLFPERSSGVELACKMAGSIKGPGNQDGTGPMKNTKECLMNDGVDEEQKIDDGLITEEDLYNRKFLKRGPQDGSGPRKNTNSCPLNNKRKFSSTNEALQYLADVTGKSIKIAKWPVDEDHKYFDNPPNDEGFTEEEIQQTLLDDIYKTACEAYKARKNGDIQKAIKLEYNVNEMMEHAKKMGITDQAEQKEADAQQEAM